MERGLDSGRLIKTMTNKGLSVYRARSAREDILFGESQFTDFLKLISNFEVKVVFIDITELYEDEIEDNLITDFDILNTYKKDILQKEIQEYNQELERMRHFIGDEKEISVFFTHEGIIYSCLLLNDDFLFIEKDVFLELLYDKYEEEIEDAKDIAVSKRREQLDEYFSKVRNYLLNNEAFKKCKNKNLRRAFIFNALREDEDLAKLEPPYTTAASIMDVVEDVWRKLKLIENDIT